MSLIACWENNIRKLHKLINALKTQHLLRKSLFNRKIFKPLDQQTELLDISEYDLQKIILAAQEKANARGVSQFKCQDIMSKNVVSLNEQDDIHSALDKFKQMNLMSLPVSNAEQQLVGTLALYEVVEWFKRANDMRTTWEHQVKHIMVRQVVTVKPEQPIQDCALFC